MPLIKIKNNVIAIQSTDASEVINIDGIRTDGTYSITDTSGGGVYPDGVSLPSSLVVTATGDTQTLDGSSRNYGLTGWGDWV